MLHYMNTGNAFNPENTSPNKTNIIVNLVDNKGNWNTKFQYLLTKRWDIPKSNYFINYKYRKLGEIDTIPVQKNIIVINAYGLENYNYQQGINVINLKAVKSAFVKIKDILKSHVNMAIHIQKSSFKISEDKWKVVLTILNKVFDEKDYIYIYQ